MNKRPIPSPDDVLLTMLKTPPQPRKAKPKPRPEQIWPKKGRK
jgi:hypothetical protein